MSFFKKLTKLTIFKIINILAGLFDFLKPPIPLIDYCDLFLIIFLDFKINQLYMYYAFIKIKIIWS